MSARVTTWALVAVLGGAVVGAACNAGPSDTSGLGRKSGGGAGNGDIVDPGNPAANAPIPEGTSIGAPGIRRLSRREYENSIRDAFGLGDEWSGPQLTADSASALGFDNDGALLEIDDTRSGELTATAEAVADLVIANGKLAPVSAWATLGKDCVSGIVDSFGAHLFRRVPTDAEKARYVALYDSVASQATPADGVKWTLVALLDSPNFLYRTELGKPAGTGRVALTGEEIATELAYAFQGTLPDPDLLDSGRRGDLYAAEGRVAAARKLLQTPRGHELLADFARQWLKYGDVSELVKDEAVVPDFKDVRADMAEETRRFLDDLLYDQKGAVADLFTSSRTFVTPALANHYGLPAPSSTGLVARPAEQAIGILAQGSILSRYALAGSSSPPQRGAFVRRKLLCQTMPSPPPNAGMPPIPDPNLTTRQLYEQVHESQPTCKGCHQLIDDIGFGLEHFDVAGRYRTEEKGKAIDPHGSIANFGAAPDAPFADHKALAALLAKSPDVADCIGGLMAAYAFGSADAKGYTMADARDGMRSGKVGLLEFFAQIAAAPDFAVRQTP